MCCRQDTVLFTQRVTRGQGSVVWRYGDLLVWRSGGLRVLGSGVWRYGVGGSGALGFLVSSGLEVLIFMCFEFWGLEELGPGGFGSGSLVVRC